jgi:2-C-methyl-D-erythritol 4-phosphate cytidylyltransferase
MPQLALILAAAGQSTRFGQTVRKKPFLDLAGTPVWVRALQPFLHRGDLLQKIIVVAPDEVVWFEREYAAEMARWGVEVVAGGSERAESVLCGLTRVTPAADFVAVHDAARPLLQPETVNAVFAAAIEHGGAIAACRMVSTVKRVRNDMIVETVPRSDLWQAQTPQVFRKELLLQAYARRGAVQPTDEAQLVELLGYPVRVVESPPTNLKLTTQADFQIAQALCSGAVPAGLS